MHQKYVKWSRNGRNARWDLNICVNGQNYIIVIINKLLFVAIAKNGQKGKL